MPAKIQRKSPTKPVKKSASPQGAASGGGTNAAPRSRGVKSKILAQFTNQLATLQGAGLPIVKSLRVLEGQLKSGPFKDVIGTVSEDVESGNSLSESLAKHPRVFDRLYVNMVRAGEAGGVLETILNRLADFSEKSEDIKSKIRNALAYPIFVILFAVAIVTFIMIIVVPKFQTIFDEFGVELPPPTRVLIGTSDFISTKWYLLFGLPLLLFIGYRFGLGNPKFRFQADRFRLKIPLIGDLIKKTIVARFSRTLGTLVQSGVPILESLTILKGAVTNAVLEDAVDRVHANIREGESISRPLGESGIFDDIVVNMVDVGEQTGELDQMLLKIADAYDKEVDNRVTALFKLIEPALLVVLAVVVGFIVISLFLPIIRIMDTFADRGV